MLYQKREIATHARFIVCLGRRWCKMAAVFRTGGTIAVSFVCVCVCGFRYLRPTPEHGVVLRNGHTILSITDLLEPVLPMADGSLPLPLPLSLPFPSLSLPCACLI